MSSQLVWLYQGDTHLRYLIFSNVYLKMGLYTVLKPSLKGENTNITKNDLKFKFFLFFPPFFFSYKKLKIFSGEICLKNMRRSKTISKHYK